MFVLIFCFFWEGSCLDGYLVDKGVFQVNLVEWLKTLVSNRNSEGVLDPKLLEKPSSRALKRTLLVALRCVDPDSQKRPKMGHVIHMLEADDFPYRDVSQDHISIKPMELISRPCSMISSTILIQQPTTSACHPLPAQN